MITVRFLGGSKKSFLRDNLTIEEGFMAVSDLLNHLQKIIPKNLPPLDVNNILVAVNGIDSLALQGKNTNLKDGDVVTIIPLIHGGSVNRKRFTIVDTNVELMLLKKTVDDPIHFLVSLRGKYPSLTIQVIQKEFSIAKKELDCILSKTPLEDVLAERSAVLFN